MAIHMNVRTGVKLNAHKHTFPTSSTLFLCKSLVSSGHQMRIVSLNQANIHLRFVRNKCNTQFFARFHELHYGAFAQNIEQFFWYSWDDGRTRQKRVIIAVLPCAGLAVWPGVTTVSLYLPSVKNTCAALYVGLAGFSKSRINKRIESSDGVIR